MSARILGLSFVAVVSSCALAEVCLEAGGPACLADDFAEQDSTAHLQMSRAAASASSATKAAGAAIVERSAWMSNIASQEIKDLSATIRGDDVTKSELCPKTQQCIQDEFLEYTVSEASIAFQGKGLNPATRCAVVPRPGWYKPFGQDAMDSQDAPPTWLGKLLKGCTSRDDGECASRNLTNWMQDPTSGNIYVDAEEQWSTDAEAWTTGGGPTAVIQFPGTVARDELRPWCICGVRTFLALIYLTADRSLIGSFLLVPPQARNHDCPAVQDEASMCQP